jgi:hypothetical protein
MAKTLEKLLTIAVHSFGGSTPAFPTSLKPNDPRWRVVVLGEFGAWAVAQPAWEEEGVADKMPRVPPPAVAEAVPTKVDQPSTGLVRAPGSTTYAPYALTAEEACDWMRTFTTQDWPLHRLIASGAAAAVWLEPPPDASPEVIKAVFLGCWSGFIAPVLEGGDLKRIAFTRDSGTLSITKRPDGKVIRIEPPARFRADALRFSEASLRHIAAHSAAVAGLRIKPQPVCGSGATPTPGGKKWTPEHLEEMRIYRAQHGTKATGEKYQISTSRVRALLPGETPRPQGHSVFTHRTK